MKRHYWFGDSWVVGDELQNELTPSKIPLHVYPHLVSKALDAKDIILGGCGESIDFVVYNFFNILPEIDPLTDTVFFCLTSEIRKSLLDSEGIMHNILPSDYAEKHRMHKHTDKWYKYFDSKPQQEFDFKRSVHLLELLCRDKKINHYFMNIFSAPDISDDLSDINWLVPVDSCLADFLLPYTKGFEPYFADNPNFTIPQWEEQKKSIDEYIKPNYVHPNVNGHKKIASELVSLLKSSK